MNQETIYACLNANDVAGALDAMAKIRYADLKLIGHHFGMGTGYGMTKAQYMDRARTILPRHTSEAMHRARYAGRLVSLADRFEHAQHHRELCAGALAMGGYDESTRDERGMAGYATEMTQLATEFAGASRQAGVPEFIRERCAQIMAAAGIHS